MRWRRGGGGGKELKFSIQTTGSRSTPPSEAVWPPCASACPAVRGPQDRSDLGERCPGGTRSRGMPDYLLAASPSFSGFGISSHAVRRAAAKHTE